MASHIPLFYRVLFLYIDPLICLSGIYLSFFSPHALIQNSVPSSLTSRITPTTPVNPIASHFIRAHGSFSIAIFALQILLLHGFKDAPNGLNVKLWRILMLSILLIDVGLIYGIYVDAPETFLDFKAWNVADWGNTGILGGLVVLRSAFILGVGGVGNEV